MKNKTIGVLILIGTIAVLGLGAVQFYLLKAAFNNRQMVFEHSVQLALFNVVNRLNNLEVEQLPQKSPIIKESTDYYVIEINKDFDCEILEFFLISEFEKAKINFDFEFAIYDCNSDNMIYGNYITFNSENYESREPTKFFKYSDLTYYFVVHFPNIKTDMFGSLRIWGVFALIFISVFVFIVYALWLIVGQKRFSELQRNFVTTVSHEFRTPIAASNVALEYLQESEIINAHSRLSKYIDLIHLQNTRLNDLIERLLQLAKSQSAVKLKPEKTDLSKLIKDVIEIHEASRDKPVISYTEPIESIIICADKFHALNVLHVITDNAIKYSAREPKVAIDLESQKNKVLLRISDNGIGIPAKYKRKIFQQFYRVPTGNIHNVKGFGIGLYYVKLISRKMKWKVNVESNKSGGTTFLLKMRRINES